MTLCRIPPLRALLGALVLLSWCGLPGCGDSGKDGPVSVLMISIDTLRQDHLSYAGYSRPTSPRIDRLAGESAQFLHAFAPRGQTWPSLTSVMTGLHPISHGVRHNGEMLQGGIPTLAELLQERGYRTGAFLTNYCHAPNRGFEKKEVLQILDKPHHVWDTAMTEQAVEWLGQNRSGEPFFLWLHLVSPHADFDPPSPYDTMFDPDYQGTISGSRERHLDSIVLGDLEVTPRDVEHIVALYDGEVAFVDSLVGRVLDALSAAGLDDETLVVFLADHGEELLDHHNYLYHGCSIYDSVLRVPLLFRLPDRKLAGKRIEGQVSLVDVLPTVLEMVSSPKAEGLDGESLVPLMKEGGARAIVRSEWARSLGDPRLGEDPAVETRGRRPKRIYGIRTDRFKYIYNPGGVVADNRPFELKPGSGIRYAEEELYDIQADPGETRNLAGELPDVARALSDEIRRWLDPALRRVLGPGELAGEEAMKALEALGYLQPEKDEETQPTDDGGC